MSEHRPGTAESAERPNIAIISGEMSGDFVGGALARELLRLRPDLELWGIGSSHMREAGVSLLYDSAAWSAISIVETLKLYPRLRWSAYPEIVRQAERRKPDVVILIDFGAFNVKVAHKCAERGIPVLYYFPPGSWKQAGRVNPEIARITKRIATPFPWSEDRLKAVGADAVFVGHPLLELVKPTLTRDQFTSQLGMDPEKPIVGLLPGSRGFEVRYNTPAMARAARIIQQELPDAQFVFGPASQGSAEAIEKLFREQSQLDAKAFADRAKQQGATATEGIKIWTTRLFGPPKARMVTPEGIVLSPEDYQEKLRERQDEWRRAKNDAQRAGFPPAVIVRGHTHEVMAHSDVLIVCSGTATLEAALLGTPMVILYRGSKLMWIEGQVRRIRPPHIGMPNIIAGRRIVPEFIQDEASPEVLAKEALRLLRDPAARAECKAALREVRAKLGEEGASERTARMALEIAGLPPVS